VPKVVCALIIFVYVLVFFANATFFLYAYGFPPFARVLTVSELNSSLGLWTGVRVRVRGEIVGIMSIPEEAPPYRYALKDPAADIYIGLTWPNGDFSKVPYDKIVTVVGVVVEGQATGLWRSATVPFLKAETIEV
jgi:hypothetical protein